jgi:hypothetical protein
VKFGTQIFRLLHLPGSDKYVIKWTKLKCASKIFLFLRANTLKCAQQREKMRAKTLKCAHFSVFARKKRQIFDAHFSHTLLHVCYAMRQIRKFKRAKYINEHKFFEIYKYYTLKGCNTQTFSTRKNLKIPGKRPKCESDLLQRFNFNHRW